MLKKFLLGSGYVLLLLAIGCGSTRESNNSTTPNYEAGQLLVLLERGAKPEPLETAFAQYELKSKGLASRTQNKYAFSFNAALIDPTELVKSISEAPQVIEARAVAPVE